MKKKIIICFAMILSFSAVGCTKVIELTDDENYLIAEYSAELLLKYDKNFNLKYYDDYQPIVHETTEEAVSTDTDAPSKEDVTAPDDQKEPDVSDGQGTDEAVRDFDISDIIGEDNIKVSYLDYSVEERYPSYDHDGMFVEISAPEGYKLLVLKFDLSNIGDADKYIDLYNKDIQYSIIVNEKKTANQMFTILVDDLYTYQNEIEPGSSVQTVILFQISDNIAAEIDTLKLNIESDNGSKTIVLQ